MSPKITAYSTINRVRATEVEIEEELQTMHLEKLDWSAKLHQSSHFLAFFDV